MADVDGVKRSARTTRPQSALSNTGRLTTASRTRQSQPVESFGTVTSGAPIQRPASAQNSFNPAAQLYSTPPPAEPQPALKPTGSTTIPPLSFGERLNQISTGSLLLPLERCYDTAIAKKRERDVSMGGGPQAMLGPVGRLVSAKRMYTKSVQESNQGPTWGSNTSLPGDSFILHDTDLVPASAKQLVTQYQLSPERYRRQSVNGTSESPPLRTVDIYDHVNSGQIASALLGTSSGPADKVAVLEDTLRITPLNSAILRRPASTTQVISRHRREIPSAGDDKAHGDKLTFTKSQEHRPLAENPDLILQQKIEDFKRIGKKSEFTVDPVQLQGCKLYEQNSKMALDAVRPSTALSSYTRGLNKKYKFTGKLRSASEMGYSNATIAGAGTTRQIGSGVASGLEEVDEKISQETKKITRSMSDWVIKSRSGSASSISIKKGSRSARSGLTSDAPVHVAVEDDGTTQRIVIKESDTPVVDTADPLAESPIVTIDSVLPIFKCIQDRIEIERIICQEDVFTQSSTDIAAPRGYGSPSGSRRIDLPRKFSDSPFKIANTYSHSQKFDVCKALRNYFKDADRDRSIFNYTTSYELMMYAENYYMNLRTQYEAFLKTSPELIASTLMQSEFIYLTYDTPAVRKMILYHNEIGYTAADAFSMGNVSSEALSGSKQTQAQPYAPTQIGTGDNPDHSINTTYVYSRPYPWQNPYELLVCAYHQINPNQYFTLSCNGICYQEPTTKTTQLISIKEWERERKFYLELRKNSFFATFRLRKYIYLWRHSIATAARNKSISALTRTSLLANKIFLDPLQEIYGLCYQFSSELRFVPFKKYCYELIPVYLAKSKLDKKGMEVMHATLTNVPNTITLKQFVVESRNRITAIKSLLSNYVTTISELLLALGKKVQQQIQGRIIHQGMPESGTPSGIQSSKLLQKSGVTSDKNSGLSADYSTKRNTKHNSKVILSALSNYSVYNLSRVKAMIRLVDYIIIGFMLDLLLQANNDLMDLFFGLPYISREEDNSSLLTIRELTQADLDLIQEDGGRKLIMNTPKVQNYLRQGADKHKNAMHEMLHQLDNEAQMDKKKDDYLFLIQFLKTHVQDLKQIATESVTDLPATDTIRLARYVKTHELPVDNKADTISGSLFLGKIKSSLLVSTKDGSSSDVYDDLGTSSYSKKKPSGNPILQRKEIEKERSLNSIDTRQERIGDIGQLLSQVTSLLPNTENIDTTRKFVDVPLYVLPRRLPPAPLFNIQLILTTDGLCMYPSRSDFINFIGDVLSDYATCVHRSIRPTSFPKLSSFLSEGVSQTLLTGVSIKDLLGEYEDYVEGVRRLKRNLEHGCDKIHEYAMGFLDVLVSVSNCISKLRDEGLIQQLTQQQVPITSQQIMTIHADGNKVSVISSKESESPDVSLGPLSLNIPTFSYEQQQVAAEYIHDCVFLCQLASEFDIRLMTKYAFPSAEYKQHVIDKLALDDINLYQAGLRHLNNKTVPLLNESDNIIKSNFLHLITELNPYLFRTRMDSIEKLILSLTKLKVKRVILCFQVDSTPIASTLLPIMIKLLQFVRFSIPKTTIIVAKNCIHKMEFYSTELKRIPDKSFTSIAFNDASLSDLNFLQNEEITTQIIDKEKLLRTKDILQYFEEARIEQRLFHELYKKCLVMMELAIYKNIINEAGLVEGVLDYFERFFKFRDDPNCNELMKDFDRSLHMFDLLLERFAERRTRLYSVFRYDLIVLFFQLQKLCYCSLKDTLDTDKMIIGTPTSSGDINDDVATSLNYQALDADISSLGSITTPTQLFYYLLNQTNLEGIDIFDSPISTGSAVCRHRCELFINTLQACQKIDEESLYFYQCVKLFESVEFFMPEEAVVSFYYRDVCLNDSIDIPNVDKDGSQASDFLDGPVVSVPGATENEVDLTAKALDLEAEMTSNAKDAPQGATLQHIHHMSKRLSLATVIESEFVVQALRRISITRRNFWLAMYGLNTLVKKDFTRSLCMLNYSSVTRKLATLKRVFVSLQNHFQVMYDEAKFTSSCMHLGDLELKARIAAHRTAQLERHEALAFERQGNDDLQLHIDEDEAILKDILGYFLINKLITTSDIRSCITSDIYRDDCDGKPPQSMPGEINQTVLKYLLLIYKDVVADRAIIDELLHSQGRMLNNGKLVKTGEYLYTLKKNKLSLRSVPDNSHAFNGANTLGYHNDQIPDDSDFESNDDADLSLTADITASTGAGLSILDIAPTEAKGKIVIPATMVQNIDNFDPDAVLVQYRKQDRIEPLLYNFSSFEGANDYKRRYSEPTMIEAIDYYLTPPSLLTIAIDLITRIETLLPQISFVSSIAFQPRHFKILTREYLRSPNLLLEYKLLGSRLLTMDIDYKDTPLFEILSQEQNNVYRVLFGPESDNITELIMFSATIIGGASGTSSSRNQQAIDPNKLLRNLYADSETEDSDLSEREEALERQSIKAKMAGNFSLSVGTISTHVQTATTKFMAHLAARKARITSSDAYIMNDQFNEIRSEKDIADSKVRISQMKNYSFILQNPSLYSTDLLYNVCYKTFDTNEEKEEYLQKRAQKRAAVTYGGLFIEMDRFTTSISRFVYRGILESVTMSNFILFVRSVELEYTLLSSLSKLKLEMDSLSLSLRPYVGSFSIDHSTLNQQIYLLTLTDAVSNTLTDIKTELNTLESQFTRLGDNPAMRELLRLKTVCTVCQDAIIFWHTYQKKFLSVLRIFAPSSPIVRQLPEAMRTFTKLLKQYLALMNSVTRNQNVMTWCTKDTINNIMSWQAELDVIYTNILKYLDIKRRQFMRFFFLSDNELLLVLSAQDESSQGAPFDSSLLSRMLHNCFDNISSLICETRTEHDVRSLYLKGVRSREGEILMLTQTATEKDIRIRGSPDIWLSALDTRIVTTLQKIMASAMQQHAQEIRNMISIVYERPMLHDQALSRKNVLGAIPTSTMANSDDSKLFSQEKVAVLRPIFSPETFLDFVLAYPIQVVTVIRQCVTWYFINHPYGFENLSSLCKRSTSTPVATDKTKNLSEHSKIAGSEEIFADVFSRTSQLSGDKDSLFSKLQIVTALLELQEYILVLLIGINRNNLVTVTDPSGIPVPGSATPNTQVRPLKGRAPSPPKGQSLRNQIANNSIENSAKPMSVLSSPVLQNSGMHQSAKLTATGMFPLLATELYIRDLLERKKEQLLHGTDNESNMLCYTFNASESKIYVTLEENERMISSSKLDRLNQYQKKPYYYLFDNAYTAYCYEYIGQAARLVISPMIDSYRQIFFDTMQYLLKGNSLIGNAGTGKTETAKDFSRTLGRFYIVLNCTETLEYSTIIRIFMGIAATGSILCLDEFNRLTLETLSVISKLIINIQQAISKKEIYMNLIDTANTDVHNDDEQSKYPGTVDNVPSYGSGNEQSPSTIRLRSSASVFVTMNQSSYIFTSRIDLPGNTMALFRPLMIIKPDIDYIVAGLFMMYGFATAQDLGRKFRIFFTSLDAILVSINAKTRPKHRPASIDILTMTNPDKIKVPYENVSPLQHQPENLQLYDAKVIDLSLRTIKAVVMASSHTFKRWLYMFRENTYIKSLLVGDKNNPKQFKEHMIFMGYIEAICVIDNLIRLLTPCLVELDKQNFIELISDVFGRDIVMCYMESDKYDDLNNYTTQVDNLSDAVMNSSFMLINNMNAVATSSFVVPEPLKKLGLKDLGLDVAHLDEQPISILPDQLRLVHRHQTSLLHLLLTDQEVLPSLSDTIVMCEKNLLSKGSFEKEQHALTSMQKQAQSFEYFQDTTDVSQQDRSDRSQASMLHYRAASSIMASKLNVGKRQITALAQAQALVAESIQKRTDTIFATYRRSCLAMGRVAFQYQGTKFLELENLLWIRNGIIILGHHNTFKTTLWRLMLDETNDCTIINPRALSTESLLGGYQDDIFHDGVFSSVLREYCIASHKLIIEKKKQKEEQEFARQLKETRRRGKALLRNQDVNVSDDITEDENSYLDSADKATTRSTTDLKFIILDGPLDSSYAECMNSLLDDNKMLCLANGERIRVSNYVRVIFETSDISQSSPSTLSRCGILCLEDSIQNYELLYQSILLSSLRELFELDYLDFVRTYNYNVDKIKSYFKLGIELQTIELLFDKRDVVLGLSGPGTSPNTNLTGPTTESFAGSTIYSSIPGLAASVQGPKRLTRKERLKAYKARDPNHDSSADIGDMDYYVRNPLHFDNNLYVNILDVYTTLFHQLFSIVTNKEQGPNTAAPECPSVLDVTFLCSNMSAIVQQSIRILRTQMCASSEHIYNLAMKDPTRGTLVRLLQGYAIFSVVWSCLGFFGKDLYLQHIDSRFQEVVFERKYWAAAYHVNGKPLKPELEATLDRCFFDPQRLIPTPFINCSKFDHLRQYNKVYWALGESKDYDLEKGIFNVDFDTVTSRIFVETTDVRRVLYTCLNDLLYYDKTITFSKLLSTEHVRRQEQSIKSHKTYESFNGLTFLSSHKTEKQNGDKGNNASPNLNASTLSHNTMTAIATLTGAGTSSGGMLGALAANSTGLPQQSTEVSARSQIQNLAASNTFLQISGFGANNIVAMLVVLLQQSAQLLPIPLRFSGTNKSLAQFTEYFENCFKREDGVLSPLNTIGGTNLFILSNMNSATPLLNTLGNFTCFPINEFIAFLMQNNSIYIGTSPPKLHTVKNYQIINVGEPLLSAKNIAHSLIVLCDEFEDPAPIISAVFTAWNTASHIRNSINPVAFTILPLITNVLATLINNPDSIFPIGFKFTYFRLFEFLRRFCLVTPESFKLILPTTDSLLDPINLSVVRRSLLQILLCCLRMELYRGISELKIHALEEALSGTIIKHLSGVITELKPSASVRVPAKLRPDVILNPDTVYLSDIVAVSSETAQPSKMQSALQQSSLHVADQNVPVIDIVLQTGNLETYDLNNYQYRQILPMNADVEPFSQKKMESSDLLEEERVAPVTTSYRGNTSHPLLQTFSSEPVRNSPSLLVTCTFPHSFDAMITPAVPLPEPCPHVSNSECFSSLVGGMQQELKRRMLKLSYNLAKSDSHLLIVYLAGIFVEQTVTVAVEALQMKPRMIVDSQELHQLVYGNCCMINETPTCLILTPAAVRPSLSFLEQLLSDPHFLAINNYHLVILAEPSVYTSIKERYTNILMRCAIEVPDTWPMIEISLSAVKLLPTDVAKVFCMTSDGLLPIHKLNEYNIEKTILYRFAQSFSLISDAYKRTLGSEHLIKTPVVFARFLRTYYKMFNERKTKLIEQETRLERGLELFEHSSAQANELETQLEKLQPQLENQRQKVASILAEISEKKLLAQEQHTAVSSEKMALAIEDKSITAEMAQAKKELNRVLPALQKADESLQNLNRQDIAELSTFTNPHPLVVLVMNALCALMNQPMNWSSARQLLSSGNLISTLLAYDKKNINPKVLAKFRTITVNPDFNPTKISSISTAATTICSWCLAVVEYATAWDNVKPKITRLEKARQDYIINKQNMELKEAELEKLQALLKQLATEADTNKAIEQELESRIKTAEERYKLVKKIKTLLEVEHEIWEESLAELRTEHASLANTITESVKFMFITLLGTINLTRDTIRTELPIGSDPHEKAFSSEQMSDLVNLQLVKLHDDEQLCMWRQHCLPSDNATTESMGCLMNSIDIPYIFDPESVAETFLSNLPNVVCVKYTSEDQGSVLQKLVDAGIRGKVCVLTNLGPEIPSFVMELVKQVEWDPKLLFRDTNVEQLPVSDDQEGLNSQKLQDLEATRKSVFLRLNDVPQEEDTDPAETPATSTSINTKTPYYTIGMLKRIVTSTPERRKVKLTKTPSSIMKTVSATPKTQTSVANTPRFNPYNTDSITTPGPEMTDPAMQAVIENSLIVKIHGYDYLFSKNFSLILLTDSFSILSQLSPELITNFQIVSFAKSRAAIEDHLISVMVKSINPKIERSYLNAVVEASIAKSSLKVLELQVLDTLMNSSLDQILSEAFLENLHSASLQKASLKRRLTFITKMHQKIQQMRNTHRPVALTCASIFLGIRQVLKLSLQTYSHVIARMIICNNDMSQSFACNAAYSHLLNLSTAIQVNSPYMSQLNSPSFRIGTMTSSFVGTQSPLSSSIIAPGSRSKLLPTGTDGAGDKRLGTSTLMLTHMADLFNESSSGEKEAQESDNCSLDDLVASRVSFEKTQELLEEREMTDLVVELEQLKHSRIANDSNEYVETIIALFILAFDESSAVAFLYHIFTYLDAELVKEPLLWIMLKCLIISGHEYARIVGNSAVLPQQKADSERGTSFLVDTNMDIRILQKSLFSVEKLYIQNNSQLESMPLPVDLRKTFSGPGENSTKILSTEILQRRNHAANLMFGIFCINSEYDEATKANQNIFATIENEELERSLSLKYCLGRILNGNTLHTTSTETRDVFVNSQKAPYFLKLQQNILSSAVYHWDVWQKCMSVVSSDQAITVFMELMKSFMISEIFDDIETATRFEDHLLILFIKHFKPAFLRIAINTYVLKSMKRYNISLSSVQRLNFGTILNISDSQLPILLNHSSSVDAIRFISQFLPQESYQLMQASTTAREAILKARKNTMLQSHTANYIDDNPIIELKVLSLSKGTEQTVLNALSQYIGSPVWLVLQNVHFVPEFINNDLRRHYASLTANSYRIDIGDGSVFEASMVDQSFNSMTTSVIDTNHNPIGATATLRGGNLPPGVAATPLLRVMAANIFQPGRVDFKPCSRHFKLILTAEGDIGSLTSFAQTCLIFKRSSDITFSSVYKRTMELSQKYLANFTELHDFSIEQYKEEHMQTTVGLTDINTLLVKNSYSIAAIVSRCSFGTHGWTSVYSAFDESDLGSTLITFSRILAHELVFNDNCLVLYRKLIDNILDKYGAKMGTKHDRTVLKYLLEFVFGYNSRQVRTAVDAMLSQNPSLLYNRGEFDTLAMKKLISNAIMKVDVSTVRDNPRLLGLADAEKIYLYQREGQQILEFLDATLGSGVMYSVAKSIAYNVKLIHYDRHKLAKSIPLEINVTIDANEKSCPLMFFMYQEIIYYNRMVKDLLDYVRYSRYDIIPDYIQQFMIQRHVDNLFKLISHLSKARTYYYEAMIDRNYMNLDISFTFRPSALFTAFRAQACYIVGGTMDQYTLAYDIVPYANMRQRDNVQVSGLKLKSAYVDLSIGKVSSKSVSNIYNPLPAMRVLAQRMYKKKSVIVSLGNFSSTIYTSEHTKKNMYNSFSKNDRSIVCSEHEDSGLPSANFADNSSIGNMRNERSYTLRSTSSRALASAPGIGHENKTNTPTTIPVPLQEIRTTGADSVSVINTPRAQQGSQPKSRLGRLGFKLNLNLNQRSSSRKTNKSMTISSTEASQDTSPRDDLQKPSSIISVSSVTDSSSDTDFVEARSLNVVELNVLKKYDGLRAKNIFDRRLVYFSNKNYSGYYEASPSVIECPIFVDIYSKEMGSIASVFLPCSEEIEKVIAGDIFIVIHED